MFVDMSRQPSQRRAEPAESCGGAAPAVLTEVLDTSVVMECRQLPFADLPSPIRSSILCMGTVTVEQRLWLSNQPQRRFLIDKILPIQLLILEVDADPE